MSDSGGPSDGEDDWAAAAAAWGRPTRSRVRTTRRRRPRPPSPTRAAAEAATGAGTGGASVADARPATDDDGDAAFEAVAAAWGHAAQPTDHVGTAPAAQRTSARERPPRHARPVDATASRPRAPTAWTAQRPPAATAAGAVAAAASAAVGAGSAAATAACRHARPTATAAAAAAAASAAAGASSAAATAACRRIRSRAASPRPATARDAGVATGTRAAATSAGASSTATDSTATTDSESDVEEEDSDGTQQSVLSQYSTDCAVCGSHVERDDDGTVCEERCCRATACTTCRPAPTPGSPPWWCRAHRHRSAATAAGGGGAVSRVAAAQAAGPALSAEGAPAHTADGDGDRLLIRDLPDIIGGRRADAAAHGIARALRHVRGWKDDKDLLGIMDDLADTLGFGPKTTSTKGQSAVRRFREFVEWAPPRLVKAPAVHDAIDVILAAYVNARCGVARRSPWSPPRPQPPGVRGEVSAVIGLLRLADLLPPDPKGTIPRTRRTLKQCGCCHKYDASPRAYTFAWELEAAWRLGVDKTDPTAVMVWCLCVVAVFFLLRPKYVRSLVREEISPVDGHWRLKWQRDDKGRPVHRPPDAAELKWVPESGLPARHPRLTAADGVLLRHALTIARSAPPQAEEGPMFCRVEAVRRPDKPVPERKGVRPVAKPWHPPGGGPAVPAYWWPHSMLSSRIIKRHMVRFLTPVVGATTAAKRVLSGCRGGGEMEHRELGTSLAVRATVGWWRAKLLAAEGAIVTYEGASVEAMADSATKLGSMYIRVLAPGVFSHRAPRTPLYRSVRLRQLIARVLYIVKRRAAAEAVPCAAK